MWLALRGRPSTVRIRFAPPVATAASPIKTWVTAERPVSATIGVSLIPVSALALIPAPSGPVITRLRQSSASALAAFGMASVAESALLLVVVVVTVVTAPRIMATAERVTRVRAILGLAPSASTEDPGDIVFPALTHPIPPAVSLKKPLADPAAGSVSAGSMELVAVNITVPPTAIPRHVQPE